MTATPRDVTDAMGETSAADGSGVEPGGVPGPAKSIDGALPEGATEDDKAPNDPVPMVSGTGATRSDVGEDSALPRRGATAAGPSPIHAGWGPIPALLPRRMRPLNRPLLFVDILLIAIVYSLYTLTRNAIPAGSTEVALRHAHDILAIQRPLHLDFERAVNHWLNHITWLIVGMNYYYAVLHFAVTICVLIWVYVKRPKFFRTARTALLATTVLALIGFYFYPLAPPRLLPGAGYIDTVIVHHTWGSWGSKGLQDISNQYAAMPSLHIGWSSWCALTCFKLIKNRWARWLWLLYPVFTLIVIIGTANHYVLDAAGGLITLAFGFAVQRLLQGRPAYHLSPELDAAFDSPRKLRRIKRPPFFQMSS
jgi:hypothetical protein